ncbi:zeta toxin-domain-containing protein [Chaetomium strumarium]|uniref:Zeta toxin-domain-containing protein n=1 Tax=Chaetomium strumarium TaxID=1170767 RepID=A0AAJ0GKJ4_9PEZI|nr:zeta toxin-domain-containing protein [Chaetomium strumarium]
MEDPGSDLHHPSNHSPPKATLAATPRASSETATTSPVDPTDDLLLAAWRIPPSAHAHILHTSILPAELHPFLPSKTSSSSSSSSSSSPSSPSTKPMAILVLGQTGAGKTRLAPLLLRAISSRRSSPTGPPPPPLHLIADTFKTYHPFYTAALAAAPHLASRLASHDAAEWLVEVCATAARERVQSVLVETACRRQKGATTTTTTTTSRGDYSHFQRLVRVFCEGGYAVRVVVLAVPAALSRLGILVRYYKRLPEAGSRGLPVRLTPRLVHDLSFEGLAEAVQWLDHQHEKREVAVERLIVIRRNGRIVYDADGKRGDNDGRGVWKQKKGDAGALRALEAERTRALSAEERKAAEEDIELLKRLGDARVMMKEVDEIQGLIDELGTTEDAALHDMGQFNAEDFVWDGVSC